MKPTIDGQVDEVADAILEAWGYIVEDVRSKGKDHHGAVTDATTAAKAVLSLYSVDPSPPIHETVIPEQSACDHRSTEGGNK